MIANTAHSANVGPAGFFTQAADMYREGIIIDKAAAVIPNSLQQYLRVRTLPALRSRAAKVEIQLASGIKVLLYSGIHFAIDLQFTHGRK